MISGTGHPGARGDVSEASRSLHDQAFVRPELRGLHREIVERSLQNYPKERLLTCARSFPRPEAELLIEGTFVPLNDCDVHLRWSEDACRARQLRYLKAIGMDTLIVLTGHLGRVCYPSRYGACSDDTDALERILCEAAELGMRVWVGLPHAEVAWMLLDGGELDRLTAVAHGTIEEIFERYGSHTSFCGWYMPYELCNVFLKWRGDGQHLLNWINGNALHCRSVSGGMPVAVAPYFTTVDDVDEFGHIWRRVFRELSAVDIFMMQDSVGIFKDDRLAEIPAYFSVLEREARVANKRLWADVEVFDQRSGVPLDDNPWEADSPACERVIKQLKTIALFVERIVVYSFCDYMNPEDSPDARRLYEEYRDYFSTHRPR